MAQTVIGFFKDASGAQKAVDRLESKGISRQQVDVSQSEYLDATADVEGRNTNKFTDLFNKLFGHDSDDAKRYSTIGQRNVTLVTVHATSNELAEEAADVLDDCGALDVDEHGRDSGFSSGTERTSTGSDFGSSTSMDSRSDDLLGSRDMLGSGMNRRSRIIDRSIDDDYRLRQ